MICHFRHSPNLFFYTCKWLTTKELIACLCACLCALSSIFASAGFHIVVDNTTSCFFYLFLHLPESIAHVDTKPGWFPRDNVFTSESVGFSLAFVTDKFLEKTVGVGRDVEFSLQKAFGKRQTVVVKTVGFSLQRNRGRHIAAVSVYSEVFWQRIACA